MLKTVRCQQRYSTVFGFKKLSIQFSGSLRYMNKRNTIQEPSALSTLTAPYFYGAFCRLIKLSFSSLEDSQAPIAINITDIK